MMFQYLNKIPAGFDKKKRKGWEQGGEPVGKDITYR